MQERATHRFQSGQATWVELEGQTLLAVLRDVTHRGVGLEGLLEAWAPGTRLTLGFKAGEVPVSLPVQLVWSGWHAGMGWAGALIDSARSHPESLLAFRRWLARLEWARHRGVSP